MPTIERLEKFNNGHKARYVNIFTENGYGASCWTVELFHEHGQTIALEVPFFMHKDGMKSTLDLAKQNGVVYAKKYNDDGTEFEDQEDWPGLDATINAAIDAFESGTWRKINN